MRSGQCEGCKRFALLVDDYCVTCESNESDDFEDQDA